MKLLAFIFEQSSYVTEPPNISETKYCISGKGMLNEVKAILISATVPSER